jgi:hypothetical protein
MAGVAAGNFIIAFRASLQTAVTANATFGTAGAALKVKLTADGEAGLEEAIYLIRPDTAISTSQEHAAMGAGRRDEQLTIPGRAQVVKSGLASETSATFAAAMNRARDLMDLIVQDLKSNPPAAGDQTLRSIVADIDYLPIQVDQGWVIQCDFDITGRVRVS